MRSLTAVALTLGLAGTCALAIAGPRQAAGAARATFTTTTTSSTTTTAPTTTTTIPATTTTTAPPAPAVAAATLPPRTVDPAHVKTMFIGDSVAWTAALGMVDLAPQYGMTIANDGINGCGVIQGGPYRYFGTQYDADPRCEAWADTWQADVNRDDPDVAVIIVGRWELMDRVLNGQWTHIGDPALDAQIAADLDRAIQIVSSHGARVALCTQPYYLRGHRPDGGTWPEDDPARVDRMNQIIRDTAARHAGVVTLVDFGGKLSPGGQLAIEIDGVKVRRDGVHLTEQAGPWLAPWMLPQVSAIATAPPPPPPPPPQPAQPAPTRETGRPRA